jgi:toxin-antitoxin system PIN domain toxin
VKVVDTNILLYAADASSHHHTAARLWWQDRLNGSETVGLPWIVLLGFVRLVTRAVVVANPLAPRQALDLVDEWLARPQVVVVHPGRRHAGLLREMLEHVGVGGNLVTDAHIAALAAEYGAELSSSDADFSRFPGVRWTDPPR